MTAPSLENIANQLGATWAGPSELTFAGACIDSRNIKPGQLFIALRGNNVDGHDYVQDAANAGARAAMVEHGISATIPLLIVRDCREYLGRVASIWRSEHSITVIAVTGSNGKTTVREMIKSILHQHESVHATEGNFNNDIGLPLTVLGLNEDHKFMVLEMGANHPGEIEYLANIARPDIGVVTNAGNAHLEGFGSIEGVAQAKGELFYSLNEDGVAVVNDDDDYSGYWKSLIKQQQVITFGINSNADVTAFIEGDEDTVRIETMIGSFTAKLSVSGTHNIMNAIAATAASLAVGVGLEEIKNGLEEFQPVHGRMELHDELSDFKVIDDTYNANPDSLIAALEVVKQQPGSKWIVLGDMLELGDRSEDFHFECGRRAKEMGLDRLFAIGKASRSAVDGFGSGATHFEDSEKLINALLDALIPGTAILVKGSRSMNMENIVSALLDKSESSIAGTA